MFKEITFLVISSQNSDSPSDLDTVVDILKENQARVIEKKDSDNTLNYLDGNNTEGIGHIISRTVNFIEYSAAERSMIPITMPEWLFHSLEKGKLLNTKEYNPDPKYFMKDCFVCVADNLPLGDKEAIYEGVTAFGGQCLDDLTKYTTHLIALDTTNEKSIIAYSASKNSIEDDKINIKIVSPNWIHDCFKHGKNLNANPYLLSDSISLTEQVNDIPEHGNTSLFHNKSIFISPDYNLSETFKNTIVALIEKNGGIVAPKCVRSSINVYLGKYREGKHYDECCKSSNIIVGNLWWLYSMIIQNKWILPTDSSLLHYPFPKQPLQDFKSLRISVTNYSGDARNYLSKLITLIGGTFTKTLTRDNDYLIAAKPKGKKYDAANTKWSNSLGDGIKIVNHVWLEDCYVNWKLMNSDQSIYSVSNTGTEALLGSAKLNLSVQNANHLIEFPSENVDIDDSMEEEADHLNKVVVSSSYNNEDPKSSEDAEEQDIKLNDEIEKSSKSNLESEEVNVNNEADNQRKGDSKKDKAEKQDSKKREPKIEEPNLKSDDDTSPVNDLNPQESNTNILDIPNTSVRGGRSAAKKAALKLQNDISDLNEYQKMIKNTKNKKGHKEELETTTSKKRTVTDISGYDDDVETIDVSKKRSKTSDVVPQIIAVMTGCDPEISLTKTDISKLSNVGIKILSDYSDKYTINTLIAPKLSRTEKFLKSLSKVDRIIHPKYITEILRKDNLSDLSWKDISKVFNIDDYSIDKCISLKELNSALGFDGFTINLSELLKSDKKGKLFEDVKLNLSMNLNGGTEVISSILFSHGTKEVKVIKNLNSKAGVKNFVTSNDEKVILVANKNKDSKLINNFKKFIPNGYVISWDWCVKSIFGMDLAAYSDFYL